MSLDNTLNALYRAIAEIRPDVDVAALSPQSSLYAFGLDSMERAEVIMTALGSLRLRQRMAGFASARTLGEIAERIEAGD